MTSGRRHRLASALFGLAVVGVGAFPVRASAQMTIRDVSPHTFVPPPGRGNYLGVETARTRGDLMPSLGVTLEYAHAPIVLSAPACPTADGAICLEGASSVDLVSFAATAFLHGAITFHDRIQVGIVIPVVGSAGDGFTLVDPAGSRRFAPSSQFGLGDPRVHVRGHLASAGRLFDLAVSGYGSVPVAHALSPRTFAGDEGPTVGGHLVGELHFTGFEVALQAGGRYRQPIEVLNTSAGPRVTYGVAGRWTLGRVDLVAELAGFVGLGYWGQDAPKSDVGLEGRAAVGLVLGAVRASFGAGVGIVSAMGVPSFRVLAGIDWGDVLPDADRDRVLDASDSCPDSPEDLDGIDDADGCPEEDADLDGVLDTSDGCPNDAEDLDHFEDGDGCADRDDDGDGITDDFDSCPRAAEDMNGDRDADGCPEHGDAAPETPTGAPMTTTEAPVPEPAVAQGALRGLVRSTRGAALTATIVVEPSGARATTDSDGVFEIALPAGRYRVSIEAPSHRAQFRVVDIEVGGVTILNADLRGRR